MHYYRELVKAGAGEALMVHADMAHALGHVTRGDRIGLADYFARLIERLARGGAEVAAISAITPHICIRELEKISPLPLVNIVAVTGEEIRKRGYRQVALFGTRFVVESRMFGMLEGVEVVVPEQSAAIHENYMRLVEGESGEARRALVEIARELRVDAIVLAGTDLNLVFDESTAGFPCLDAAQAHVLAIVKELQAVSGDVTTMLPN